MWLLHIYRGEGVPNNIRKGAVHQVATHEERMGGVPVAMLFHGGGALY
jgi:hypothetical protein